MKDFIVYITTNKNKTVLYTGITNDITKRLNEHRTANDLLSFTAKYRAHRLVYMEKYQNAKEAIAREKEIKGWRREKKVRLIETINPYWKFLDEGGEY